MGGTLVEIHQLRYFIAVAESRSFTRAAEHEHVSQPPLSHQIHKLEEELGAPLFDRQGRTIRLTDAGKAFLLHARSIVTHLNEGKAEVLEIAEGKRGRLSIGASSTIAPHLLPVVLPGFALGSRDISITVAAEPCDAVVGRIRDAILDIALVTLPVELNGFDCEKVLEEPLYVAVPNGHELATSKITTLREVADQPILFVKEGCLNEPVLEAFRTAKIVPNIVFESSFYSCVLALVTAGMGIAFVPEMASYGTNTCTFIPLQHENASRSVGIVSLTGRSPSGAQKRFVQYLKEVLPGFPARRAKTAAGR